MRELIFDIDRTQQATLQSQIRATLVNAILSGQLPPGSPTPSTRDLARRLMVSRNTVTLAYLSMVDDGYLEARDRSGFYVAGDAAMLARPAPPPRRGPSTDRPDFSRLFAVRPSRQRNIDKPLNWHDYPYPFIYGQADPALFPIAEWRECTRQSMNRKWLDAWTDDRYTEDDPMLIDQIRQRLLPRRGIQAGRDEILVTMGAQNALYLLAKLFCGPDSVVGIEDPGYPDARNIFSLHAGSVLPLSVDGGGLVLDSALERCGIVFTTPSHQFPTGVTMGIERRRTLLDWARRNNRLIIEDDYEFEANYLSEPTPALKALDGNDPVIYVGSLSKSLMPGLRLGYLVAAPEIIAEARALRRLILRHPPGNNQRVAALFLALGYHDRLIGRLHRTYRERQAILSRALSEHFPGWTPESRFGGTSCWLTGPKTLDGQRLAATALQKGVLIEPGDIFFAEPEGHDNHFRMGFSSIPTDRIERGVEILGGLVRELRLDS
ncbi:MocR-like pyridoxine biosynthesis transcription factor PdxR [Gellertiella hungarica]|uniref:GntR family transcriptional regulator/MocR family aminotransferase n=1 Tax=Gellertiella hungarica TaxID=1572859 RepID=A0A7W6J3C2_9HYPH|nr:PLP-dependent aminotransferase family protein [Gellertiella hungarica]MBB4063957.1 GntR family transcriptional regulator/MocR family aminotransferase [Gellertiella hungarica]